MKICFFNSNYVSYNLKLNVQYQSKVWIHYYIKAVSQMQYDCFAYDAIAFVQN